MNKVYEFKTGKLSRESVNSQFNDDNDYVFAYQTEADRALKKLVKRAVSSTEVPTDLRGKILAEINLAAK